MSLTRDQRQKLIDLLLRLPHVDDGAVRRLLLADLPPGLQDSVEFAGAPTIHISNIVSVITSEAWDPLPDESRPVIAVIENAVRLVQGSTLARDLLVFRDSLPRTLSLGTPTNDRPAIPPPAGKISFHNAHQLERLRTLKAHTMGVTRVAFSPTGTVLASASYDNTVRLWRVSDGVLLHTLRGHTSSVDAIAFSPDGAALASGSADQTIRIWTIANGSLYKILRGHQKQIAELAFIPPHWHQLASVSEGFWGEANALRVWNVPAGTYRTFKGNANQKFSSLAIAPDGHRLVTGSCEVEVWSYPEGKLQCTLPAPYNWVQSLVFSPRDPDLLAGSYPRPGGIRIWRLSARSILHRIDNSYVNTLAFSPDGQILACACIEEIQLRLVADGSLLYKFHAKAPMVNSLAFSPDGAYLATGCNDNTVGVWGLK